MIDDEEELKDYGLIEIDGCNVAECCNLIKSDLKKPICKNGGLRGGNRSHLCEDNNDCYFRQLQRAKAELEQYKKSKQASYETMQKEWNNAVNESRELKAENEKLKAMTGVYSVRLMEKYKQALEDIKQICTSAPAIDSEFSLRVMEAIKDAENEG